MVYVEILIVKGIIAVSSLWLRTAKKQLAFYKGVFYNIHHLNLHRNAVFILVHGK